MESSDNAWFLLNNILIICKWVDQSCHPQVKVGPQVTGQSIKESCRLPALPPARTETEIVLFKDCPGFPARRYAIIIFLKLSASLCTCNTSQFSVRNIHETPILGTDNGLGPIDSKTSKTKVCSTCLHPVQWCSNLADHRIIWGTLRKEVFCIRLRPTKAKISGFYSVFDKLRELSRAQELVASGLETASQWCSHDDKVIKQEYKPAIVCGRINEVKKGEMSLTLGEWLIPWE